MISKIEIGENQVSAYKQETFIAAGTYYRFLGSRPSDLQKKRLSLKACSRGSEFLWLAPFEPWVKRIVDGQLDIRPSTNEEPDWGMVGLNPCMVRRWQAWLVKECWNYLRNGIPYRKGWVAPLGAGKTLGGLLLGQFFEPGEVAVLASRYLHETWKSEAKEWGLNLPLLSSYESSHKLPAGIKCLIVDEVNALKNPDAQRSVRATAISSKCEVAIGFTGIVTGGRGPVDLRWLRAINAGCVPADEKAFQFMFGLDTALKEVGANKAYVTTKWDNAAVSKFVAPFLNTVNLAEISAEMPDITYTYIQCEQPQQFESIKAGAGTTRGTHKRLAQVLQATDGFIYNDDEQPIRIVSDKLRTVREWVDNLGEPVVLVSNWTDCIIQLSEIFQDMRPAVLSGSTKDPGAEIDRFKTGNTSLLIANAGFSKGMNLQKVCRVIGFLSVSSKPDDLQQMVGRVARPGQKDAVQITFFVSEGSLDRRRIELVQAHRDCSEDIILKLLEGELMK